MSWFLGATYSTAIKKTERIGQLYPDAPQVWDRVAWAYYNAAKGAEVAGDTTTAQGYYDTAFEYVQRELRHDDPVLHGKVYQLMGLVKWRQGALEQALDYLNQAVQADPRHPLAYYRLGQLLEELGRLDETLAQYEHAAELLPTNNPLLNRLAQLYRRLGRPDAAREIYEQALRNNAYEEPAILGLAQLDLETATDAGAQTAVAHLQDLLAWMPENVPARINLGVALTQLGRTAEAVAAYEEALNRDPASPHGCLEPGPAAPAGIRRTAAVRPLRSNFGAACLSWTPPVIPPEPNWPGPTPSPETTPTPGLSLRAWRASPRRRRWFTRSTCCKPCTNADTKTPRPPATP